MADNTIFGIAPTGPNAEQDYQREANMASSMEAAKLFGAPAFFGAGMVGAVSPPPIPFEVQARMQAQQQAQKRFSELNPSAMEKLDSGSKSRIYRRFLAEEAFRAGLPDIGSQLYAQVSDEHEASMKQAADLEKVGVDNAMNRSKTEKEVFDLTRSKLEALRGKMATIWAAGSTNPNSGMNAFIDDSGNANVGGKIVPLGKYSTVQPRAPRSGGGGGRVKLNDYFPTNEQKAYRATQRDVRAQMEAATRIHGIFAEAVKDGGSLDIMGAAGKPTTFVTQVVDTVTAMGRQIQKAGGGAAYSPSLEITDANGEKAYTLNGTPSSADKAVDYFDDVDFNLDAIPASMRKDETSVRRYKAAMINLTYAVARAMEPGNPRLSDDDFKRNLEQMAANSSSPESLRRVILDTIKASVSDFDMMTAQVPTELRPLLNTPEANQMFVDAKSEFDKAYATPFGTGGNPGPGLKPDVPKDAPGTINLGDGFTLRIN